MILALRNWVRALPCWGAKEALADGALLLEDATSLLLEDGTELLLEG